MISLDKSTGELIIGKNNFNPYLKCSDFEHREKSYVAELLLQNEEWKTFKISDINNGENIFVLRFYDEQLKMIEISLGMNYINYSEMENRKELKRLLEKMGGADIYSWGIIEFNEDLKGGYVSLLIKYSDGSDM
jgi:hypothetical protein